MIYEYDERYFIIYNIMLIHDHSSDMLWLSSIPHDYKYSCWVKMWNYMIIWIVNPTMLKIPSTGVNMLAFDLIWIDSIQFNLTVLKVSYHKMIYNIPQANMQSDKALL